jgi:hypothetical protein
LPEFISACILHILYAWSKREIKLRLIEEHPRFDARYYERFSF